MFQLADYRPAAGRIFVRRLKGSNSGEYHLTKVEQHVLRAWLRERGTLAGALFNSRNHKPVSRFRLGQLMKKYCDHLGHANIANTMKYVQIASKRRDDFAGRLEGWGR